MGCSRRKEEKGNAAGDGGGVIQGLAFWFLDECYG